MILNKVCELEDWRDPVLCDAMRLLNPHCVRAYPNYPESLEHRKAWEYGQLFAGLKSLDALRSDAIILSVAAGHETPVYELTNHVRWVFATDIYGSGEFTKCESDAVMLRDPDHFALAGYNRNRLVVQYMNALDLRFEEGTFDVVFSLSSIEHFGREKEIRAGLREMERVLKPGGVLMLTTECIVNGAGELNRDNLELFTPQSLARLLDSCPRLRLLDEIRFTASPATLATVIPLKKAVKDAHKGRSDFPHIVLELEGRLFTSISVFLRKTSS
jgi:SAM-dependent methyltransferase